MDNLSQSIEKSHQAHRSKPLWPLIVIIILMIIAIGVVWKFTGDKPAVIVIDKPAIVVEDIPKIVEKLPEPVIEIPDVIVVDKSEDITEPVENPIPLLDDSDNWLKLKLPEITWRKELLTLIIDEDMIRRFVVFTDNFAQGIIAYEHSPFILPSTKFTTEIESGNLKESIQKLERSSLDNPLAQNQQVLQWNENSSRRFSLYVDLLRSMDIENLVQWYSDIKPLIDEAYRELGYEEDFTGTLQDAITRVLDMELPKSSMTLIQPSVMYKFADPELESLPDSDKLLLRLGKENLLVMKSVLLELYEKLAQQENGIQ